MDGCVFYYKKHLNPIKKGKKERKREGEEGKDGEEREEGNKEREQDDKRYDKRINQKL